MRKSKRERVLVTSHHYFNLNSGACLADYKMFLKYSEYYETKFINYTNLRITDPRIARIIFPIYVLIYTMLQFVKLKPFHIIHSNTSDAAFILLTPISKFSKVITQSHGLELIRQEVLNFSPTGIHGLIYRFWTEPLLKVTLSRPKIFVSINKDETEWMKKHYPNIEVVHSSVGTEPSDEEPMGYVKETNGIGIYFGRFDLKIKGIDFLATEISLMLANGTLEKFIFAGMNHEGKIYLEDIFCDQLQKVEIISTYSQKTLPQILSKANFFVISSRVEGGPIALLEGMSFGLIPVVSRIPFAEEVLQNRYPSLFFEVGIREEFERAIKYAINEKIDKNEFREISMKYVWDVVLTKRIRAIQAILSEKTTIVCSEKI